MASYSSKYESEEFPDPDAGKGRPRVSYEGARPEVEKKAGMKPTPDGKGFQFNSFKGDGTVHLLNGKKQDENAPDKHGKISQAHMDHEPQYKALEMVYDRRVLAERAKEDAGQARASSPALFGAFVESVKDPEHLTLKTRQEHSKHKNFKAPDMSKKELVEAHAIFEGKFKALSPLSLGYEASFYSQRPKASTPLSGGGVFTPMDRSHLKRGGGKAKSTAGKGYGKVPGPY